MTEATPTNGEGVPHVTNTGAGAVASASPAPAPGASPEAPRKRKSPGEAPTDAPLRPPRRSATSRSPDSMLRTGGTVASAAHRKALMSSPGWTRHLRVAQEVVGRALAELREANEWTHTQVADLLFVRVPQVGSLERGHVPPRGPLLKALGRLFAWDGTGHIIDVANPPEMPARGWTVVTLAEYVQRRRARAAVLGVPVPPGGSAPGAVRQALSSGLAGKPKPLYRDQLDAYRLRLLVATTGVVEDVKRRLERNGAHGARLTPEDRIRWVVATAALVRAMGDFEIAASRGLPLPRLIAAAEKVADTGAEIDPTAYAAAAQAAGFAPRPSAPAGPLLQTPRA